MKIHHVEITNWCSPFIKWWDNGAKWWAHVESRPDEPLIEATMTLTLSWREYNALIEQSNKVKKA